MAITTPASPGVAHTSGVASKQLIQANGGVALGNVTSSDGPRADSNDGHAGGFGFNDDYGAGEDHDDDSAWFQHTVSAMGRDAERQSDASRFFCMECNSWSCVQWLALTSNLPENNRGREFQHQLRLLH